MSSLVAMKLLKCWKGSRAGSADQMLLVLLDRGESESAPGQRWNWKCSCTEVEVKVLLNRGKSESAPAQKWKWKCSWTEVKVKVLLHRSESEWLLDDNYGYIGHIQDCTDKNLQKCGRPSTRGRWNFWIKAFSSLWMLPVVCGGLVH